MEAYLVVNHFLNGEKFNTLHNHLVKCAADENINMHIKTNLELAGEETENKGIDFVLFWDKDVHLARRLEKAGIKVFNSSLSIELCDDKAKTYTELFHEVPQPETFIAPMTYKKENISEFIEKAAARLSFPLIFKECFGSFGEQVFLCEDINDIEKHLSEKPFVLQKFVFSSAGCDRRLEVVDGEVIAAVERYNKNDFRSNVTNGGSMEIVKPSEEEKEKAVKACSILGLLFGGVDILKDGSICEVNSNAHIINLMNATGIDAAPYIFRAVKKRL